MEKTKEQLVEAFKKNNKERRKQIALKEGLTVAEYLLAIYEGKTKRKAPKAKTRKTKEKIKEIVSPKIEAKKKEMLDYVVAFDTTGSMNSYIGDVKKHVEKIIPEMFSQDIDLRMKIIAFGDYCDMTSSIVFGNAYQESEFTNDQSKLMSFIQGAKGTNGGDGDEFYELVIKKITEETPWREGAKKAVLFIADENPHKVGYSYKKTIYGDSIVSNSQIDWKQEAKKAAEKTIAFDTLAIHGNARPWYKELSSITGGVYMPFKSSNKMSEVVKMSAYSRGSATSKAKFTETYTMAVADGDTELIGTYKSLSSLL